MTWDYLAAMSRGFLFALAAILPILNPAATAPIFLSLTEAADDGTRTLLARRIARNMFLLLAGSMLVGSYVLDFFGISLPIVRVGGGLLALLACGVLLYLAFRYAQQLLRPLGEAGTLVFLRLAAFILLCLGVQIIWEGASDLLSSVVQPVLAWSEPGGSAGAADAVAADPTWKGKTYS